MSDSSGSGEGEAAPVNVIFEQNVETSSEEPPMEEWSSLVFELPEENIKRIKYDQGLYDPGSGEICTKYVAQSASSVLRHPYFNYPGILDPGIEEALLQPEPKVTYSDDGQELYLALCKEADLCPIKIFHQNLFEDKINLKYYGINPKAFRVIAMALKFNRHVTVLDLTDNWISLDGCFHLGEMLLDNITLTELNLYGCRIGPEGARRLMANLHLNRSLKILNLGNNQLKDQGLEYLAKSIFRGADITDLNLTRNELSGLGVMALCDAFETNNKLVFLDLSWNNIFSPNAIYKLCTFLFENESIRELNLSWNSLAGARVTNGLAILLKNPKIKSLNLSNNKLSTPIVLKPLIDKLMKGSELQTLNLSNNPLTPENALDLLRTLKVRKVKIKNLLLDNVVVTEEFTEERKTILSYTFRKNTTITHGRVLEKFVPKGVDMRELVFNRIDAVCKMSKKRKVDFALVVQEIYKENKEPMDVKLFSRELSSRGALLDEGLSGQLYNMFAGPKMAKSITVDIAAIIDYITRKWPDRKLPPTPPPEPAPLPNIK